MEKTTEDLPKEEPLVLKAMSSHDLKTLAIDMVENKVFGSWQLRETETDLLPCIFMPIIFMGDLQRKQIADEVGGLYEYYSEASPRGVNGYPTFFSFRILLKEDVEKLFAAAKNYEALKNSFFEPEDLMDVKPDFLDL